MIPLDIVLWLWTTIVRPDQLRCPPHMWMPYGVRPTGDFVCAPPVVGGDDDVLTGRQTSRQPEGELHLRVYCDVAQRPVIRLNGIDVVCADLTALPRLARSR